MLFLQLNISNKNKECQIVHAKFIKYIIRNILNKWNVLRRNIILII